MGYSSFTGEITHKLYKTILSFSKVEKNNQTEVKNAAICFSGLAKNLDLCYPYIKKNLLDQIGSHDIFCCVEDDENANKVSLLNPVRIKKVKSSDVDKIVKDELKSLKKQNYKTILYIESFRFNLRNAYMQMYKINQSFELLKEYMKEKNVAYKNFIRIRFDLLPLDSLKLENFTIKKDEIIIPHVRIPHTPDIFNDMFCITNNLDTFRSYCSLYPNFKNTLQRELSIKMTFLQKLYFFFEKKYTSFFFFLFGKLGRKKGIIYRNLFGIILSFPKIFYKKFKSKNKNSLERVFFYYLKYEKRKIKEIKINFVIVRNLDDGLLIFG